MINIRRLVLIKSFVKLYSLARKTHYDILNLQKNCTSKDIKEAYIKLSKAYHPDKNKDAQAPDNFILITEAYNVLSNRNTRALYDRTIHIDNESVYRPHVPYNLRKNPNYNFYQDNYKSKGNEEKKGDEDSYYGVRGWRKMPNYVIIALCGCVALVGFVIQMIIIRHTFFFQRKRANEKSTRSAAELERVRAAARENGNELQTRLLMTKIVNAANPTVATAALGKELASEKK